jgi:hypothetical protein
MERVTAGILTAALAAALLLAFAGPIAAAPPPTETAASGALPAAADAEGEIELAALRPLPRAIGQSDARCSADGRHCIRRGTYIADVCRTIEAAAEAHALDPHFFARLVWKESLFDASAVSPKGAQGIAQFMPGTAKLRGLEDPFNPAEALLASAAYLAELSDNLGNIGLAAVAYNGGEARAARFIAREGGLPTETRDYVEAITGHPAETWRDAPPAEIDLSLKPEASFRSACIEKAAARTIRDFRPPPPPWGIIVATNRERAGAERQVARLKNRLAGVIGGEAVRYVQERRPGLRGLMWHAQLGGQSREEADALCDRIRRSGGDCMVLKN